MLREECVPMVVAVAAAMVPFKDRWPPNWRLWIRNIAIAGVVAFGYASWAEANGYVDSATNVIDGNTVKGMLIADYVVSEDIIEMQSNEGEMIRLQMPKLTSQYSAQEDVTLQIQR